MYTHQNNDNKVYEMSYITFSNNRLPSPDELDPKEVFKNSHDASPTELLEEFWYSYHKLESPQLFTNNGELNLNNKHFILNFIKGVHCPEPKNGIFITAMLPGNTFVRKVFGMPLDLNRIEQFLNELSTDPDTHNLLLAQILPTLFDEKRVSQGRPEPIHDIHDHQLSDCYPLLVHLINEVSQFKPNADNEEKFEAVRERLFELYFKYYTRNAEFRELLSLHTKKFSYYVKIDSYFYLALREFALGGFQSGLQCDHTVSLVPIDNKGNIPELLHFFKDVGLTVNIDGHKSGAANTEESISSLLRFDLENAKDSISAIFSVLNDNPKSNLSLLAGEKETQLESILCRCHPEILCHIINEVYHLDEHVTRKLLIAVIEDLIIKNCSVALRLSLSDLSAYPDTKQWLLELLETASKSDNQHQGNFNVALWNMLISNNSFMSNFNFKLLKENADLLRYITIPPALMNKVICLENVPFLEALIEAKPDTLATYYNSQWTTSITKTVPDEMNCFLSDQFKLLNPNILFRDIITLASGSYENAKRVLAYSFRGTFDEMVGQDYVIKTVKELDLILKVFELNPTRALKFAGSPVVKKKILKYIAG